MSPRVAIVDFVQTEHGGHLHENVQELTFGVVRKLMDRVGIDRSEIGTMISSSADYWQGISCSNSYYYDSAGGNLKSGSKVGEDSVFTVIYGMMRILSGHYRTALLVAVTKCSECPSEHTLSNLCADPFFHRPVGINGVAVAGLQARQYLERHSPPTHAAAQVVVKNRSNAAKNPYAHVRSTVTVDEVLSSPTVAAPLRKLDVPVTSDGACALLLAEEGTARDLCDDPVFIEGVGWNVDRSLVGDRDLRRGSLHKASAMAYGKAGIRDPGKEIDVAEISETSSYHEILWSEGLGLCGPGEGWRLATEGLSSLEGTLPINPSGGLFGANPQVARGLVRVGEAYLQVLGEAGDHQVPNVRKALAHSVHGLGGQSHSVVILGH
ncbi:MAG: thiolase family protein [Desulfomonilaceae bacterium]|nr:thiolase family protein [Desulfomonilaceae bacterium]